MTRSRSLRVAIALSAIAIPLSACGGDDGESGGGAATSDLEVEATDFAFSPSSATIVAGEASEVTLDNAGVVEHNYSVVQAGTTIENEDEISDDLIIAEVATIAAGETGSSSFTLDADEYQVICTIPGHLAAGMEGTLTAQ